MKCRVDPIPSQDIPCDCVGQCRVDPIPSQDIPCDCVVNLSSFRSKTSGNYDVDVSCLCACLDMCPSGSNVEKSLSSVLSVTCSKIRNKW
ncbi:hypothetical protein Btru_072157 [Bulinus truncatus]|nr:hypothetical protein Btru_072157 [Bulinus truncatus]